MSTYTDGFVIPLPKKNIDAYREMAEQASAVWLEQGALEYRECVLDDAEAKDCLAFPVGVGAKPDETIVFSWIVYPSRADRDRINKAAMEDPRIKDMCGNGPMPFDCGRMLYGGFRVIVDHAPANA